MYLNKTHSVKSPMAGRLFLMKELLKVEHIPEESPVFIC